MKRKRLFAAQSTKTLRVWLMVGRLTEFDKERIANEIAEREKEEKQ